MFFLLTHLQLQQYQTCLHHNNEHNNVSRGADQSSCVSFVLVQSRMNHVDFSPTLQSEIAVSCQRTQHIPIHIFTERGCDTKVSEQNSDFQKYSSTYFIETTREVASEVNLLFRHNRCRETSSRGMLYLQPELASLNILHSAFCVHSIVSALIITHARTQPPPTPHVSASAFALIFSPKNGKIPGCISVASTCTLD